MGRCSGWGVWWCALAVLAGCAQAPQRPAPVEERRPLGSATRVPATTTSTPAPSADNAGKPGYYTVRSGDTLIKIGLDHGQNWRDLVRWNNLDNPNVIESGQVLRVTPPAAEGVVVRPVNRNNVAPPPASANQSGASQTVASPPAPAATQPVVAAPASPAVDAADEALNFMWPSSGPVMAGFDDPKNKGLDLAGKAGDPVLAAADGRVVYAGAGLRGYGNLVIIKHNNVFLTAYAHNQSLLVKEDQAVKRGQKIAEMGNTDADQVKLHFEIRRQGKPVDPARYLPATR